MTQTSFRTLLMVSAAAVSLTLLTGCSSASGSPVVTRTVTAGTPTTTVSPPTSPSQPTTAAPASSAASSSAAAATPASSVTRVDPNAPAGQCKDSALKVSVQYDPEASGAGQRGAFVAFRNTGSSTCHLEGTPGLSLVGSGNGTEIGPPAERGTSGAKLVTLKPGGTALAQVQYTYVDKNGGVFGDGAGHNPSCQAEAADGYRVYPPHSYRAYFSPAKTYACSTNRHWISVGPVRPASDFKYFTPDA